MSNLKPKSNPDGTPASISQISRMLRNKAEESTEETPVVVSQQKEVEQTKKEEKTNQQPPLVRGTELENMILEAKQHRGLEIERRPIMVDTELYDIFAMLKAKKRVPAAGLVSLICRQWVIQNKGGLEQILGQKINVQ